jgi:hypothetical protein
MLEEVNLIEFWKNIWGILGPILTVILLLYIFYPEKIETMIIHILKLWSFISDRAERRAISQEVTHIISTGFTKYLRLEEVPKLIIKWGEEDKAILDLRKNMLIIVLRRGKKHYYENIARALLKAIPELLAPEMKVVYDSRFVDYISAHIARSLARDYQPVITAINEFIASEMGCDKTLNELILKLIEIDDESLLSRILLPELIRIAKMRYPYRDPEIDKEVQDLIRVLHGLVKGDISKPLLCGKYFRMVFVRVARPEKIAAALEPHIHFVKHSIKECPAIEVIYVLAAGKNIMAAKALKILLEGELKSLGVRYRVESEFEYTGMYKRRPSAKLYVCKIELERIIPTSVST